MPVDEHGNAGSARRDVRFYAMVHGLLQALVQSDVHDRSIREGEESIDVPSLARDAGFPAGRTSSA